MFDEVLNQETVGKPPKNGGLQMDMIKTIAKQVKVKTMDSLVFVNLGCQMDKMVN